jgi:hypothetical protein
MTRRLTRTVPTVLTLLLTFALGIAAFAFVTHLGWSDVFGTRSESHDSQVIRAVERTQEVSLVSLGIQGITEKEKSAEVFGHSVPGTGEEVFLQYGFNAKLGVDGADVDVTKTGKSAYRITVPDFIFIGYDEPTFKVATQDSGVLSWLTADIDQVQMVNEILNDGARQTYLTTNQQLLEEQTKTFYDSLISSIDPAAHLTYEFSS